MPWRRRSSAAAPPADPLVVVTTMPLGVDAFVSALESWHWLDLEGAVPLFSSMFGDVFLRRGDSVWRTDIVDFGFTHVCDGRERLDAMLADQQVQDSLLRAWLVHAAVRRGLRPGPGQIYSFVAPPVLGGEQSAANLDVIDFEVGVHLAGQLWSQVRELPPGTRVTGFAIGGPDD